MIHQLRRNPSRTAHWHELGWRVAELLAGAWRDSELTAPTLSEAELNDIVPLLCESGAGALAWWRIRNTALENSAAGGQLHDVYRKHRLSVRIHEQEITNVLSLLRAEGIEPVLIKGWAIARLYPDAALRPYGDIDLCVRPDQFEKATVALKYLEDIEGHHVDLHSGFARIGQTKPEVGIRRLRRLGRFRINAGEMQVWDELFSRSQLLSLQPTVGSLESKDQSPKTQDQNPNARAEAVHVRILSDEDHLRVLAAHLLRSGARRPPWLCDVALLLELRAKDFKWDVCLSERLHDNWLASSVMLAKELLGSDISHTPFAHRQSPQWLVPAVLCQWGRTRVTSPAGQRRLWTSLYARWDNPVRATAAVGGQFNNFPRLPYRLAELFTRVPEAPQQLLSLFNQLKVTSLSSEVSSEDRAGQSGWNAKLRLTEE